MSSRFFFFFSFFSSFSLLGGVGRHEAVEHSDGSIGKEVVWTSTWSVSNFQHFCEHALQLRRRLASLQDAQPAPQIPVGTVAEAVCFTGALGLGSLLQCGQQLRTEVGQQWFGQAPPTGLELSSVVTQARPFFAINVWLPRWLSRRSV
jgi:hypothetical protein